MLADNAITYAQDRSAREWTFNYYLSNASYRLRNLQETWPSILDDQLPVGKRKPKNRWDRLQKAFAKAVDALNNEIQ